MEHSYSGRCKMVNLLLRWYMQPPSGPNGASASTKLIIRASKLTWVTNHPQNDMICDEIAHKPIMQLCLGQQDDERICLIEDKCLQYKPAFAVAGLHISSASHLFAAHPNKKEMLLRCYSETLGGKKAFLTHTHTNRYC